MSSTKMEDFKCPDDLKVSLENDPKMKYDSSKTFYLNMAYGQVKLFSNELEFMLSYVFKGKSKKKKIVLYIGAGPGEHLVTLVKMFPTVEWHLFDNRFDPRLDKIKNVHLELRYFDDISLEYYKVISNNPEFELYMISDIRNLSYDSKNYTVEEAIKSLEDMNLQRRWVEELLPKYSMLKFKLPINEKEITDVLGDTLEYLPGIVYKQPWARGKSIETRLVISGSEVASGNRSKVYSIKDFEEVMFYHNAVTRQKEYRFPFSDELNGMVISKEFKLNKRYDTAFIVTILNEYFVRMNPSMYSSQVRNNIIKVLKMIGKRDRTIKYLTSE